MTATRPSVLAREDAMVVVEVDAAGTRYRIHKALLTRHSEYFKKALTGQWKEADEGVVRLKDISCGIFDVFVDWLYTSKVPYTPDNWYDTEDEDEEEWDEDTMMKVTALGHRLLAPKFLKAAEYWIVEAFQREETVPRADTIIFAFDNLPSASPILRLLVDMYCFHYNEEWHSARKEDYPDLPEIPYDFLVRVMLRHSEMRTVRSSRKFNPCDYHNHEFKEERENCNIVRGAQRNVRIYGD